MKITMEEVAARALKPKELKDILQDINPKTIIDMREPSLTIGYKIHYSYTTIRGNKKNGHKIFLFSNFVGQDTLNASFNNWIELFNKEHQSRPLLKVKFLSNEMIGVMGKH